MMESDAGAEGVRYERVARLDDLRAASQTLVEHASTDGVLVVALGEDVYAIDNLCTHSPVFTLHRADIDAERREIVCRWHGGRFSLETGEATRLPCRRPIRTYDVRIEDDFVYLAAPEGDAC